MRSTPTLSGEVTYVSADSLTGSVTGLPYFRVTLAYLMQPILDSMARAWREE